MVSATTDFVVSAADSIEHLVPYIVRYAKDAAALVGIWAARVNLASAMVVSIVVRVLGHIFFVFDCLAGF